MKQIRIHTLALVAALCVLSVSSCKDDKSADTTEKKSRKPFAWFRHIIGNFSSQDTIFFDSTYIDRFLADYDAFKPYESDIRRFYRDRKYAYAWFEDDGIIEQSNNLYARVQQTEDDGLEQPLPYQDRFAELMDRPNKKATRQELELMLTSQYLSLATIAWKGLSEKEQKALGWFIPRKKLSYTEFLDSMLQDPSDSFLEDEPVNPMYQALRAQLKRYTEIDSTTKWTKIPDIKKPVRPGDSSFIIPAVRERLIVLGELNKKADTGNIYDDALETAVIRYQDHHGLKNDGLIVNAVIHDLNVPVSDRIEQIVVNMERTRWLPQQLTSKPSYILVNIPEYKLHIIESNKEVWNCNVVVGDTGNKTVVFTGMMNHVVFSPNWNVPESIVKDEIIPSMEKDPEYLQKQDLEITGERNGLPVVRQKPGAENSLGLVKFMFPNTHNIYLHDSPAKELFNRNARAFSHGCVRVSEPDRLASYVLRDMPEWNEDRINEAMNNGEEKYVTLKTKVPVFIVYFTAWVDNAGALNFRKDIYQNDARLARMILKRNMQATAAVKSPSKTS
ncbi:MAG TPA: L,D-transpeptidase family protein [Flavitalea sp.]|nr:L,D-transpeptidase family protein [Flavitalea sp.]